MTRTIVVTGCDANHFHLAADLVASLRDVCGAGVTVGFVHVGGEPLPPAIGQVVDHVARAVDADNLGRPINGFRLAFLGVKALLPEYFPGFDTYVWLDGDTWVQNAAGVEQIVAAAAYSDLSIHPERDGNYDWGDKPARYLHEKYSGLYGVEDADRYSSVASFNAGVFGARGGSPLWRLWSAELDRLRARWRGHDEIHFSDQTPLHRLIASQQLSITPLRAVNNWLCLLARPALNAVTKRLHVPSYPYEEINILHLVGATKTRRFRLLEDGPEISLRYGDIRRLFVEAGP